jgi:hypothetical protein
MLEIGAVQIDGGTCAASSCAAPQAPESEQLRVVLLAIGRRVRSGSSQLLITP